MTRAIDTRLHGPWRLIARLTWMALAVLSIGLYAASLPLALREPPASCADPAVGCNEFYLNADDLGLLAEHGLPAGPIYILHFIFNVVFNLAYIAVAIFIFWRRPGDWLALLISVALLSLGTVAFSPANEVFLDSASIWRWPVLVIERIGYLSFLLVVFIFPDGRFVPHWIAFVALPVLALTAIMLVFSQAGWLLQIWLPVFFTAFGFAGYSLIYRYRHVSTPVQRQQTKWVGFGLLGGLFVMAGYALFITVWPARHPTPSRAFALMFGFPLVTTLGTLFPFGIALAVLRYRLWDVDVLIRRTLVYTLLTAALAGIYFGSVALLQSLLSAVGPAGQRPAGLVLEAVGFEDGRPSAITTVASTLAIAALFTPLRRRVQHEIDHRFFRRHYDAARTLAAFGQTARDETDIERLSGRLVEGVRETMQPAQVLLWLVQSSSPARPSEPARRIG